VADTVGRTLGPGGANVLVRDEGGDHFATKDGYTVLQRLTYVQETATMVLDHVRSVSRAMVRKVGDGSTSAVVMADALYSSLLESRVSQRFAPGSIQAAIGAVADSLAERIGKAALSTTDETVGAVATISANNDPEVGKLIAALYSEYGSDVGVNVTTSQSERGIQIVPEAGFRVLRGMVHDCFANEVGPDGVTPTVCRLTDAVVLVLDLIVDQPMFNRVVAMAMNRCLTDGRAFVAVSHQFTDDVVAAISKFRSETPSAKILLVDHSGSTRGARARLGDLAAVLGASVITRDNCPTEEYNVLSCCGFARAAKSTRSETVFSFGSETTAGADARATELGAQLIRLDESNNAEALSEEIHELRSRIRALQGSQVTVAVGGPTEQERRALAFLIDDAVLAVRAAISSGTVEGMGMTAVRILYTDDAVADDVGHRISLRTNLPEAECETLALATLQAFYNAYIEAASRVLVNAGIDNPQAVIAQCVRDGVAYNALTRTYSPVKGTQVINPVDTDVEVLRGAASIVSLFISSNQIVLTRPVAGGGLD
jgi:chaperonin GroEL